MVGTIVLEKTDRVGDTAREAAAGDLRAEASALYPTDGEHGFLKASDGNAGDAVRTMEYMGALEIFHLADAQTHFRTGKEPVHE
jgi:hypothetical protein